MKEYSKIINRMSKKEEKQEVDKSKNVREIVEKEKIEKADNQEETPPEWNQIRAVVDNCTKLNVRQARSKESKVLCVINKGDVVLIEQTPTDFDDLDDSWVHVLLSNGILEYVMGDFLKEV